MFFFNISFHYIKIRHIYTTTIQRNAYIVTIWLFLHHVSSHKSDYFGFILCYFVWFPDYVPLWTETCGNVTCDIKIWISKEQVCAFFGLVSWICYRHCTGRTIQISQHTPSRRGQNFYLYLYLYLLHTTCSYSLHRTNICVLLLSLSSSSPPLCRLLTFRRLMSYIYGAPILDVSRSHTAQHRR